jgi:hypothetical protein
VSSFLFSLSSSSVFCMALMSSCIGREKPQPAPAAP